MPRHTLLERIVEERVGQTLVGTTSVAVDKVAEEIAREALSDETFRRTIRELVHRRSQELLERILKNGDAAKRRASRGKPRPRRPAAPARHRSL